MGGIVAYDHLITAPKDGADGEPAVGYYFVAEPSVVHFNSEGEPTVKSVKVTAYKAVGGKVSPYGGASVMIYYDTGGSVVKSVPVLNPATLTPSAGDAAKYSRVDFRLIISGNVVATISIPYVSNGSNGTNGKDGTSFVVKGTANGHAASEEDVPAGAKGLWLLDSVIAGGLALWYPEELGGSSAAVGDAYIINGDIWVAGDKAWNPLGQFRGPEGAQGPRGAQGSPGPMSYLAGEWQSGVTYTRTEDLIPVVSHKGFYWRPDGDISILNIEPSADNDDWELVSKDDMVFARIVMSDFGKFGSAIMVGDYLFSQFGKLNGETIDENSSKKDTAYTQFNADNPEDSTRFVPSLWINFRTGELHCKQGFFHGEVNAESGTFNGTVNANDGIFKGICRQPFVLYEGTVLNADGSSYSALDKFDNVSLPMSSSGWNIALELPWAMSCIGRKLTIANFEWLGVRGSDNYVATAPLGCQFYEGGRIYKDLYINREIVELLGYGDTNRFYGWIVINRVPINKYKYSKPSMVFCMGSVTAVRTGKTTGTVTLSRWSSSNGVSKDDVTVTRVETGKYTIKFPVTAVPNDDYIPIVTGSIAGTTTDAKAVYACVAAKSKGSFTVLTADDDSLNEGGFNFVLLDPNGWDL